MNNTKKLLNVINAKEIFSSSAIIAFNKMITELRARHKSTQHEFFEELERFFANIMAQDSPIWETFYNLLIPVYVELFSDEEIDAMIKFYKTPLGKKILKVTPLIASKSVEVANNWEIEVVRPLVEERFNKLVTTYGLK